MARHVNASFVGTRVADVDVDAPTFKRTVEDVVGDVALTHDKLNGTNGIDAGETVNHSGGERGCLLGLPMVNQLINADMLITTPTAKDEHGGVGEHVVAPYIVRLMPGETGFTVRLDVSDAPAGLEDVGGAYVRVFSTAMVEEVVEVFQYVNGGSAMVARVRDLPSGFHLVFPIMRSDLVGSDLGILRSASIHHERKRRARPAPERVSNFGVWEPSATEGVVHRDFDTGFFGETQAIDGYVVTGLNRNMNGLDEYVSGWPCGGNVNFTQEDHDDVGAPEAINPRRSRFHAHTRSGIEFAEEFYPDEPEIAFPLFAATCGPFIFLPGSGGAKFVVELASPPTYGMLAWQTPWPEDEAQQSIVKAYVMAPDFQTQDSRLKMAALILSDGSADVDEWEVTTTSNGNVSAGVAPVNIDGGANNFWLATNIEVPFDPDVPNEISLGLERLSGTISAVGEIAIVAWCLYYEP